MHVQAQLVNRVLNVKTCQSKSISNGASKLGKTSKNEGNSSPMVHHFERKNEYMNSITSNLRNTIHNLILMSSFFYLHNDHLFYDNLYFMHKQNINTKHNFYNFIPNMYILIKLLKIELPIINY